MTLHQRWLLFGIDPGIATGFAVKFPDGHVATATFSKLPDLWEKLRDFRPDAVAVETFARSERIDHSMIFTMEAVGSVMGACFVRGIPVFRQRPQERYSFIPDAEAILSGQLQAQGRKLNRSKQGEDHEIQALAHLLLLESRINSGEVKLLCP